MSRPHWTCLGMPQGKCAGCGAGLPMVPAQVWWNGDDLYCRPLCAGTAQVLARAAAEEDEEERR